MGHLCRVSWRTRPIQPKSMICSKPQPGDTIRSVAPSLPVFPTLTSPVRSPQTGLFFGRPVQHPRQMVFIFASNFEFSAASTSTYCGFWSVGFLDATGFATAIGSVGLSWAVEGLDVLCLPSICGDAVPL